MLKHRINKVEPILLSVPYSVPENLEVQWHLPSGFRTCGMLRILLDNGCFGLGEAYMAVFAPLVFKSMVELLVPYIEGRFVEDREQIVNELNIVTGYWSRQGAARHIVSAFDTALFDLAARLEEKPLYQYLNPKADGVLNLYASGGDSADRIGMTQELDEVEHLGIQSFKIRSRKDDIAKTCWTMQSAAQRGIRIAVDMTQNLVVPSQTIEEVLAFRDALPETPVFLEEPLGPDRLCEYPLLRRRYDGRIAGGEIITHPDEMFAAISAGSYDIAQPDATVIGGVSALKKIFECQAVRESGTEIFVHCWGGPVGMAANYHTAAACGGKTAEWPLPYFPIREQMPIEAWNIKNGHLKLSSQPGLGMTLSDEILAKYPFRPDAVYCCLPKKVKIPLVSGIDISKPFEF